MSVMKVFGSVMEVFNHVMVLFTSEMKVFSRGMKVFTCATIRFTSAMEVFTCALAVFGCAGFIFIHETRPLLGVARKPSVNGGPPESGTGMTSFKDNFSRHAAIYSKFRPDYPPELFDYLASLVGTADAAWDCGTGNGQAALGLARHFKSVFATDPSAAQIAAAPSRDQVRFSVGRAEQSGLPDSSVDLISVAQAYHWFDFEAFHAEVRRVLRKNGILAVWAYGLPVISPEIDRLVRHVHDEVVGEFWQAENRMIEAEYATVPFPFPLISVPEFHIRRTLSPDETVGLVRTWSAVQRFIEHYGTNPVVDFERELGPVWGNPDEKKEAVWRLILKIGRNV